MNIPESFAQYGKVTKFKIKSIPIEDKVHHDSLSLTIEDFDRYGEQFLHFATDYAESLPHFAYLTKMSYNSSSKVLKIKARTHDLPF